MHEFLENLLALPDTKVTDYRMTNEAVYICVESTHSQIPCRKCGRATKLKGLGQEIKLRHLPIGGRALLFIDSTQAGYM